MGAKQLVYRYCVFGHNDVTRVGDPALDKPHSGGIGELFGNDFMVNLGGWTEKQYISGGGTSNLSKAKDEVQAALFMHELGHTLGLKHGGLDDINGKPNYLSIMNYGLATKSLHPVQRNSKI
ncbi:MAG: hypothetical protein O3C43_20960 [Verrucomicrobia bacterium]|nr:hypothetical protein [Verrucomicrobiota bacterium]MDA1068964.1 hypothetical protein [Verrucomicrobiota bacterium]